MNNVPEKFTIRLTMLSDWHVGTGAGRPGSVDKLLARDADGFPFVPAKTVNGIWRDAMETLTFGLDDGGKDESGQHKYEWQKFVELIFGAQPNQIDADELARRLEGGRQTYSNSLLSIQPARLHRGLRGKINSFEPADGDEETKRCGRIQRQKYLDALTFIKPGVEIDGDSGAAKPEHLRFEEMGRCGTVLEAACELHLERLEDVSPEREKTVLALLVASAKLVERIGGKRRRGAGRCELAVEEIGMSVPDAIQHLQAYKDKPAPDVPEFKEEKKDFDLTKAASDDGWQRLEFSLTLETPVSIVAATLGNVSESLDFIPGTYLLPHFTKILGKQLGKEFFHAVAYGDFQISPATIEIKTSRKNEKGEIIDSSRKRGLPVPKVLAQEKVGGGFDKKSHKDDPQATNTIYNQLKESLKGKPQTKALPGGYVQSLVPSKTNDGKDQLPAYISKSMPLLMHNVVDDPLQRPTENVGGVFSRQAIAAGTTLRGEIRVRNKATAEKLAAELGREQNQSVRLGTSKKDDYGLARITLIAEQGKNEAEESAQATAKNLLPGEELIVYLESDVLLRNKHLRPTNLVEDFKTELETVCGAGALKSFDELTREAKEKLKTNPKDTESEKLITDNEGLISSLVQIRRIESWHEGWGFPRPTLIAMAAGSCMKFKVTSPVAATTLQELENSGVGERRGEGYGRIRFNPPLLTQPINSWQPAGKPDKDQAAVSFDGSLAADSFVKQIEETVWREELKVAVLKIASVREEREKIFGFVIEGEGNDKRGVPPMSQVGGLRSVISRLQKYEDGRLVLSWIERLKKTKNRCDKWPDKKKKGEDKLDDIRKLVESREAIWKILKDAKIDSQDAWHETKTLTGRDLRLDEKLWAEAIRALFDACARAHKRELEKDK